MKMQWNATGSVNRIARRPDQRWIRFTRGGSMRTIGRSFPKIRAPVDTCTTARTAAPLANHALNTIVDENTEVTMSVYVDSTLASIITSLLRSARVAHRPARRAAGRDLRRR